MSANAAPITHLALLRKFSERVVTITQIRAELNLVPKEQDRRLRNALDVLRGANIISVRGPSHQQVYVFPKMGSL